MPLRRRARRDHAGHPLDSHVLVADDHAHDAHDAIEELPARVAIRAWTARRCGTCIADIWAMHTSTTPRPPTIRAHFIDDHRRLESVMDRLLEAFAADARDEVASLWTMLDAGLSAHMEAEEAHLIPRLRATSEKSARRLLDDHEHFRARLMELGAGIDLHIVQIDTARAFIDELRQHARLEDEMLYTWSDAQLGEVERVSIIDSLAALVRQKLEERRSSRRASAIAGSRAEGAHRG
jgi:hemerythrin-like domain-containing protein